MISFDDFLKQDEADKYNMLQECNAYIQSKDKEIDRLNSKVEELMTLYITEREVKEDYKKIINELEKYINEEYIYDEVGMKMFDASVLQDKLQELKGSGSNE